MRRKLVRLAGILGVMVVLAGVGAYIARNPLRDQLARLISTLVSRNMQGTLEIGTLRGSLVSTLVLRDVVLRDQSGAEVVRLPAFQLSYNLTALLSKRLVVRHARLTRPHLTLRQMPDGAWNLPQLFASPSPTPSEGGALPLTMVVEDLQLSDGHLTLSAPSVPGLHSVDGLQVRLHGQLGPEGGRLTIEHLSAYGSPADVRLRTVQGVIESADAAIRLTDVQLQTARTHITATGQLPGGTQPASLRLHMQPFDVTEIGRLLQREDLAGALHLSLTAEGPPDALALRGQLHTEGGQLDWQAQLDITAPAWRYESSLAFTHVNLATLLHQDPLQSDLNLRLQVEGAGTTLETLRGVVRLDIQDSRLGSITLHPSRLHAALDQGRVEVQECDVHTSAARLTATGLLDLAGHALLRYDLNADLAGLQPLLTPATLQGHVRLQGQASGTLMALSTQGTLTAQQVQYGAYSAERLRVQYAGHPLGPEAHMTAQLALQGATVDQFPVERLALDLTYDSAAQQVQVSAEVGPSGETGAYKGKVRGTLGWTETALQVGLEEFTVQLVDHPWRLVTPATFVREAATLRLTPLRLAHADETLELAGTFDGEQFHDVRLQMARLDLSFLQRWLALPELVQGRASAQAHVAGTLAAPVFDLAVQLQLPAQPRPPLDQLQATFAYAQQRLRGEVRVRQARREVLTLEAQIPLDFALKPMALTRRLLETPVTLRMRVQQPELGVLASWQPAWPRLTGTLQGDITVQGPPSALALEADMRLQQLGLAGSVEDVQGALRLQAILGLFTPASTQGGALWHLPPRLQQVTLRMPTLRGQFAGTASEPQTFQIQDLLVQAAGQWGTAGFEGSIERAQAQVRLPGQPRTEVRLAGQVTPQRLEVTQLQVRLPQSEVRGRGTLTLPQQQLQLTLELPRLQLDEVGVSLPPAWPSVVQGTVEVRGTLPSPQVETRWRYAGGQLRTALSAALQEPVPRYHLSLRLDDLDLAQLFPGERGRVSANVQVQGTGFSAPQRRAGLELRLETSGATLLPGLTAQLKASLEDTTLRLTEMQLRSAPLTAVARGVLSTTARTALTYDVTLGDLTPLQRYLGAAVQARGRLHGSLQGTWPAVQARSNLELRDWRYGQWQGRRLQSDVTVAQLFATPQATLHTQIVGIQGPAFSQSTVTLAGTATPSQGTVQVNITAGPYQKTSLEGKFTLADEQRLTLTRVHLRHQQGVVWDNTGPLSVTRNAQGRVALEGLLLRHERQEIRAQGILTPEGGVQAEVQVQRVQLLPHLRAVAFEGGPFEGELTSQFRLEGTLERLQGDGTVRLSALRWHQHELGEITSQVRLKNMTLGLDVYWRDRTQEILHLFGDFGLAAPQHLSLQVRATQMDAQLLKALSPGVTQSSGAVRTDIHVTGTRQDPKIQGTLQLQDGAVQFAATGVQYKDIQLQLRCQGTRVELVQLHAVSGEGTLDLTGWADLAGFALRALHLDLKTHRFVAIHTPEIEAEVSVAVTVRGTLEDMLATGTMIIPQARVQAGGALAGGRDTVQPWQLTVEGVYGAGPGTAKSTAATPTASTPHDPLAFLRTDLLVELPRNVWVRGPGTAIELSGALSLTKEHRAPLSLSGTVETVRGFASFYSGRFVVEQGRVTFTGSTDVNPMLDITLTREVSSYVVSIHVGGRAKTPQLQLSSTPDLPQADIVTLLVVGKTTDRLTAAERSGLSNQAQQIVGNVAAGELEQLLAKPLGLDTLDIQTGSKLGDGKVSVGRYITQDIFLSYERQLGDENSNKVGVEYSINRHLKLKGSGSNTGDTALDVLWRIDY